MLRRIMRRHLPNRWRRLLNFCIFVLCHARVIIRDTLHIRPNTKAEKKSGIYMSSNTEKKSKKRKSDVMNVDGDISVVVEGKSPKKPKKEEKDSVEIPIQDLSPLANPLAQKKLLKKLHKTIKKASKARQVKRGVKEIVKGIRKGEKGLLILAADIYPMDIISHLPVLSEEAQIPYIFVPSKEELGNASSTKRPTSCVMVCPDQKKKGKPKEGVVEEKDDEYRELYDEVYKEVEKLDTQIIF